MEPPSLSLHAHPSVTAGEVDDYLVFSIFFNAFSMAPHVVSCSGSLNLQANTAILD